MKLARRVSVIGALYNTLGVYTGAAALTGGTFLATKLIMQQRSKS